MSSTVTNIPFSSPKEAMLHFESLLCFETDCWDVHYAISYHQQDFILLDVRGKEAFEKSHIVGAINLPHARISEESLAEYPVETLFVVYCAGPHCNATEKAAIRLSQCKRPVKKMIGGIAGWITEGFELVERG